MGEAREGAVERLGMSLSAAEMSAMVCCTPRMKAALLMCCADAWERLLR